MESAGRNAKLDRRHRTRPGGAAQPVSIERRGAAPCRRNHRRWKPHRRRRHPLVDAHRRGATKSPRRNGNTCYAPSASFWCRCRSRASRDDCAQYVGDVAARFDPETCRLRLRFPVADNRPAMSVVVVSVAAHPAARGLQDLRLHDLRHSFSSFLVNEGVSLYVVQALRGHGNARTTQRYAHLASDMLSDATEIVDGSLRRSPHGHAVRRRARGARGARGQVASW